MKRELSSVVAGIVAQMKADTFALITAYNMDGSGWEQTADNLVALLDQETYVLYDISFSIYGIVLQVYFPSNIAG